MTETAPVSALIVDDEPIARAGLRRMLADCDWIACVGEAASGSEALRLIDALRPELVFLDIEMPELTGLDVARNAAHQPHIVFTTAFSEHAVAAFELGAIDYLLKPFGPERLQASLDRVRAALGEPRGGLAGRIGEALGRGPMTRLFVRTGRSIVPIATANVAWFEAVGDYVAAHVGTVQHLLHVSLNRLEERLDAAHFRRIHRTHIVNLDNVRAFRRRLDGRVVAEMLDGTLLAVSRAKAQELRDLARG